MAVMLLGRAAAEGAAVKTKSLEGEPHPTKSKPAANKREPNAWVDNLTSNFSGLPFGRHGKSSYARGNTAQSVSSLWRLQNALDEADLIEAICKLTLLEATDIVKELEKKLGVSAAAPMVMAMQE